MKTDVDLKAEDDAVRFEKIVDQVIAIASSNFKYRLIPSGKNDEIDAFAQLLNMLSEEIYYSFFESRSKTKTEYLIMTFLLDKELNITYSTPPVDQILKLEKENYPKNLVQILTPKSVTTIRKRLLFKAKRELKKNQFMLSFNADEKAYSSNCNLFPIDSEIYILTAFKKLHYLERKKLQYDRKSYRAYPNHKIIASLSIVRKLRLYILKNLKTNLPSIPELAKLHNTNPTTLKTSFKKFYGITINRFHLQKRLDSAALLLRTTSLTVNEIAFEYGFKDPSHFSKRFKERFHLTPSHYRSENKS